MLMATTITRRITSLYVAYAPDSGTHSFGGCFEEAVNNLADKLRTSSTPPPQPTGEETK
jgi:hypothetical protein